MQLEHKYCMFRYGNSWIKMYISALYIKSKQLQHKNVKNEHFQHKMLNFLITALIC